MRERLPDKLKPVYDFAADVIRDGGENELSLFAPAMAFSLVVSLAPLTIALNAFTAQAFSPDALVPNADLNGMEFTVGDFVGGAYDWLGPFAAVVAGVLVLFGASRLFRQYGQALGRIWRQPGSEDTLWTKVRKQLFSVLLLFVAGLALFFSAVVGSAVAGISGVLTDWGRAVGVELGWLSAAANSRFAFDLAFATLLFTVAYATVPPRRPRVRDVLPGAVLTAVAYAVGQWVLGMYLGNSARIEQLGAFGAFLGFLLWGFYTSTIVLWGAQVAYHIARRRACGRGGLDAGPYLCADRSPDGT